MSVDIERTTIYEQTTPAFDPDIFGADLAAEMPETTTTIVAGDDGFVTVQQGVHGGKSPQITLYPEMVKAIVDWAVSTPVRKFAEGIRKANAENDPEGR